MFDDSKRLDALEGQMKAVQKSVADIATLKTWAEAQFKEVDRREDNRGKIQQQTIQETEDLAKRLEGEVKRLDGELKKATQRISLLEQQVKSLKK